MASQRIAKNPRSDADVALLQRRFPDLDRDGRILTHEDIEATLKVSRKEPYYRTVIKHWRRGVFYEHRIYLDGISALGAGFKALTPDEMVRFSNAKVRAIGRALKKAIEVAASPEDGEIVDPGTRMFRARLLSGTEQIALTHGRLIREIGKTLGPPKQLPRAAPGP